MTPEEEMTPTQKMMMVLEERDYRKLGVPKHLLHFMKKWDLLAYYSLQLEPFFYEDPWDLPVVVDGRRYRSADLSTLQVRGMSSADFHTLLTDIEVALIEAAGRRGIYLCKRGKVDEESNEGTSSQRQMRVSGRALRIAQGIDGQVQNRHQRPAFSR